MVNERPRGILTHDDRELLEMSHSQRKEEYSRPNLSQRWKKIDERILNAVLDLPFLARALPAEHRANVFGPISEHSIPWAPYGDLSDSIGWMLLGYLEQMNEPMDNEEYYERVFQKAIVRTLTPHSGGFGVGGASVEVDVTIDGWAPHDAVHEHEELSDLRREMLRDLFATGEISDEEFARAVLDQEDAEV